MPIAKTTTLTPGWLPIDLTPRLQIIWIYVTAGSNARANQRLTKKTIDGLDILSICNELQVSFANHKIPFRILALLILGTLQAFERKTSSCESAAIYIATRLSLQSRQSRSHVLSTTLCPEKSGGNGKNKSNLIIPKVGFLKNDAETIMELSDLCQVPPFRFSFTPGGRDSFNFKTEQSKFKSASPLQFNGRFGENSKIRHSNKQDIEYQMDLGLNNEFFADAFECNALDNDPSYENRPLILKPLTELTTNCDFLEITREDSETFDYLDSLEHDSEVHDSSIQLNTRSVPKRKRSCLAIDDQISIRMPINSLENVNYLLSEPRLCSKMICTETRRTDVTFPLLQDLEQSISAFCMRKSDENMRSDDEEIEMGRHGVDLAIDGEVLQHLGSLDVDFSNLDVDDLDASRMPWAMRKNVNYDSQQGTPLGGSRRTLSRSNSLLGDERGHSLSNLSLTPISTTGEKMQRSNSFTSPLKSNSVPFDDHMLFDLSQENLGTTSMSTVGDDSVTGIHWKKHNPNEVNCDISNKETIQFLAYFTELIVASGVSSITIQDIAHSAGEYKRRAAARALFHVLDLVGHGQLKVRQSGSYSDINVMRVSTGF